MTLEQIKSIPWNSKYLDAGEVPFEPKPEDVKNLLEIPFMKRDKNLVLFYCWNEIIDMITGSDCRVLDTACGRGQVAQVLHYYGHEVSACDIDNIFNADSGIKFIKSDLNDRFPYEDNIFDYVINCTALHYLKDTEHYFKECRRVLKHNGDVVFTIPNIESLGNRLYFLKTGILSEYSSAVLSRRNFIYPAYLYALLEELNFKVTDVKGVVPIATKKIKTVNLILGKTLFGDKNEYIKYSPILVIKARLSK
ncbi:MAG: class I SAM-dependent methyltransferase [Ignavibacteria bacterium]|nr:class I SAM-dependent methyltransferase [Ignavibacteria bacterium]